MLSAAFTSPLQSNFFSRNHKVNDFQHLLSISQSIDQSIEESRHIAERVDIFLHICAYIYICMCLCVRA